MGIDSEALEVQEAQMAALSDVRKKWHIQPAFSVEFIGYFLDRITRLKDIKSNLEVQVASNTKLVTDQQYLKERYDQMIRENEELGKESEALKEKIQSLHLNILSLCPNKPLPLVSTIGKPIHIIPATSSSSSASTSSLTVPPPASTPPARPMSVPTAAALKMGVGFPLQNPSTNNAGKILSTQRPVKNDHDLLHNCGICKRCTDQHLLAKCDTCHLRYHLGCLSPPLTRHPKKSKLYGWQCSECDKSDGSDTGVTMPEGPRKSRTRYSKEGIIVSANSRPVTPVKVETVVVPVKAEEVVASKAVEVPEVVPVNGGEAVIAEKIEDNTTTNKVEEEKVVQVEKTPIKESTVPLHDMVKDEATTSPTVKIEPMVIPKMKITPTRGRGRGRGRGSRGGRQPGRKSLEKMTVDSSTPVTMEPLPIPEAQRTAVTSPTSLPVSIPVLWPTSNSPVGAPLVASPVPIPPPVVIVPVTTTEEEPPVVSTSTPKATAKSEKKRAKKEKKHNHHHKHQQPVYFIAPPPPETEPPEIVAVEQAQKPSVERAEDGDDEEDEEEEEDEVPETNESIVDKNLMNLSHEMAQSTAIVSELLATDEDKANHHRKKKNKEKHKNKSHDLEHAAKEHKRKRKRKYGMENTTEEIADVHGASHPRIKIKFKAIPIPGTSAMGAGASCSDGEKQFVYVPPEEVVALPASSPRRLMSPHKIKSPMGSPAKQTVSQ